MLVLTLLAVLLEDFALEEELFPLLVLVDLLLVLAGALDECVQPSSTVAPIVYRIPDGSTQFTGSFMQ